jgi:hypothetical protein
MGRGWGQACNATKPQIQPMYKRDEARRMIFQAWQEWPDKPEAPTGNDALRFFTYLENNKPNLLNFLGKADKCQDVHSWLIRNGDVPD